jgi:tetratricopeptide (TPR) repeat protein
MKIGRLIRYLTFGLLLIAAGCSTEKNTLINRTYHGTTARFNGWFNANELIRMSIGTYRLSRKEDYYSLLTIDPLPNEEEVVGLFPSIDTAIVKCTRVIQRHSMPSNDRPSQKREEHNSWIDENWTMIGVASFYRRDYEGALNSFDFVRKFYKNDKSIYVSLLWMAKANMEMNNMTEAGFNLAAIDQAIAEQESGESDKKSAKESKSKSKKGKKEEVPAEVPKSIRFDLEKTKAEYALRKKNPQDAIKYLNAALEFAKKPLDKSRVHFILAQLYEISGDRTQANKHYTATLKSNAPYEMHFNARLKRAFNGGDEKVRKELLKMLRDAKNATYKDQIYYALAEIELQRSNQPKAFDYLTASAFFSTTNTRQKGMAYEKMGDLSFAERNYVKAQKYYDSCGKVIDERYPNAEGVRNKAEKLADLVRAVETAAYEDSVQRIAKMGDEARVDFVKKVIKQQEEEAARKKKREAERMLEIQEAKKQFEEASGSGEKWYFNNTKVRTQGYDEFRKLWGTRENEDNWRRSDKDPVMPELIEGGDTVNAKSPTAAASKVDKKDTVTVESMLANVPLTDSALQASNLRLIDALYTAGIIYKEQLNEPEMAKKQFNAVLERKIQGDVDLSSSYQLFKLNEANPSTAAVHKDYILTMYPNSDYANYLRDPDFFIKRKEREALAEQEYLTILDRYNRRLYGPVLAKAESVIQNEPDNKYRAKYMLLKALSMGQTTENKQELLPVLNQLVAEYPKTEEEKRAKEMITIITTGYSKNTPAEFGKKSPYTFDEKAKHSALIFIDKRDNSTVAKNKVSDFNRQYFSRLKLKVSSKVFGDDQSVILVQDFENDAKAIDYMRIFKTPKKHTLDLSKVKIVLITEENLKILFERQNLSEYELFHDEFY